MTPHAPKPAEVALPPLPATRLRFEVAITPMGEHLDFTANQMRAYATSATEPLRSRIAELERENEALRADARRYRWLRDDADMTWCSAGDGMVKWVVYVKMPEPDISAEALTDNSVRLELDAAIDAALSDHPEHGSGVVGGEVAP